MTPLVIVHGTFGRSQAWHQAGSDFMREAEERFELWRFLWSGALFGVPTLLPGDPEEAANGADDGRLLGWLSEGEKLAWFLQLHQLDRPVILSHSHGLQVVAFSCWKGARYSGAVSVSGPIRADMQRARRRAMGSIGRWVQFTDPNPLEDPTILEGEFSGGVEGVALPEGETILTPGTGHSGMLNDPQWRTQYGFWEAFA